MCCNYITFKMLTTYVGVFNSHGEWWLVHKLNCLPYSHISVIPNMRSMHKMNKNWYYGRNYLAN